MYYVFVSETGDSHISLTSQQDTDVTQEVDSTQQCSRPETGQHLPVISTQASSPLVHHVHFENCQITNGREISQYDNNSDVSTDCVSRGSQPSKYKQSILQRYLLDTCSFPVSPKSAPEWTWENRRRHGSGSLSSHDYEDISLSSRSSPTYEHNHLTESTGNCEGTWGAF